MSEAKAADASVALQAVLTAMAGPDALPRPGQVDAVAALLSGAQRVLVVQATGWGKSASTGRPPWPVAMPEQGRRSLCHRCLP